MRYGMWLAGAVAGLVLAGCGTASSGPEQRESGTEPVGGAVSRVEVDSDAGDVRLVAGGQPSVARELRWTGDAKPVVEQRVEGDVLRVTARCPDSTTERCQAGLTITVPEASSSRVDLGAGGIEVTGLSGDQDVRTAAGDVRGSGIGPGAVTASSSGGDVDLTVAQPARDVTAESTAGDVDVRVPAGPVYTVGAETTAGETRVDVPDAPGAEHRVTARSTAGDVVVTHGS
ncbi:DUF4097 family beta strand repeat-containing protein [Pseudonocardia nantongensis]|uniref:DUF4097 family beta strand repeat-containing protein n=1 Tax=Pseudonocardia nantongensis TaxID=1181885 RepID=UPI003979590B